MTPTSTVFEVFLGKILDERFVDLPVDVSEADLKRLLSSAIFKVRYPKIELTLDSTKDNFVNSLSEDEIELIASIMVLDWFNRLSRDINNYTEDMTTSEFKTFSKGNKLKSLVEVGKELRLEIVELHKIYHMRNGARSGFSKLGGE